MSEESGDLRAQMLEKIEHIVTTYEALCHRCKAGFPDECVSIFDNDVECPEEKVTSKQYVLAREIKEGLELAAPAQKKTRGKKPEPEVTFTAELEQPRFDSGYIHPDAWRFQGDIGSFADPESTGRKMVKRMYPVEAGVVCEWAKKRVLGWPGGAIVGCINNPASDWHHGPDKNTLNNEKVSLGIGGAENVHILCSSCHNLLHAQIDKFYPGDYDRIADQARPWLPLPGDWGAITFEEADIDELLSEERRRLEAERRRGRKTRGRAKQVTAAEVWGDED